MVCRGPLLLLLTIFCYNIESVKSIANLVPRPPLTAFFIAAEKNTVFFHGCESKKKLGTRLVNCHCMVSIVFNIHSLQ